MAKVFIPYAFRKMAENQSELTVPGATLRAVINNLDEMYPGFKDALVQDDKIKPGIAAVCGYAPTRKGLMQPLEEDTEVHFVPAISGGTEDLI